jgi:uncharacterized Zn finger protein
MGDSITYEIQGSSPDPYVVTIGFDPFTISCTCTAAENGWPCKHRIGILSGENSGIVKGDLSLLPKIKSMIAGTVLFEMLAKYDNVRNEKKNAVKRADYAFKNYRESREDFALKKVKTDRNVTKYREALESAIDEDIEAERAVMKALETLQTVFIRPGRK